MRQKLITAGGLYSLIALAQLANNPQRRPMRITEIARKQGISLEFLQQLFRKLKAKGILTNVRGPGGGYVLALHENEISIRDILDGVGETTSYSGNASAGEVDTPEAKAVKAALSWVDTQLSEALGNIKLSALITPNVEDGQR